MKKKLLVTVMGITLAFSMLTGCGSEGKDTTTTMESEAVQTTDEATDNTTVADVPTESEAEDTTSEVSDVSINFDDYNEALFGGYATDSDGNELRFATNKLAYHLDMFYSTKGGVPANWNEVVEYVDVDGEQWVQATYTFDDDAYDTNGYTVVDYAENPFVIAVSPDKTKVLYKDVVYTRPEQ